MKAPHSPGGDALEIVGATANNLKGVDVAFPRLAATMVVGPSGSGKSSLLEDTLATEATGRMKRFLGISQDHLEQEDVPAFVGPLPACVHFAQGAFRASQRTTVATCSGLLSVLRRLFLKLSVIWSDVANELVPPPSPGSYAAWLRRHYRGRLTVTAVPLRFVVSDGTSAVRRLQRLGFTTGTLRSETDRPEVWERGRAVDLERFKPLATQTRHILEVEVGRAKLPVDQPDALEALLARAFEAGQGTVVVELHDAGPELAFLRGPRGALLDSDFHHVHPSVMEVFAPPSDPLLSFNMPANERSGACPECKGIGQALVVREEALVIRPDLGLHAGALSLWTEKNYKYVNLQHETIEGLRGLHGFDPAVPWSKLPSSARKLVLEGSQGVGVEDRDRRTGRRLSSPRPFEGFVPAILRRYATGSAVAARLAPYVQTGPCPSCRGTRWSPQARALRVGGMGIADLLASDFTELARTAGRGGSLADAAPAGAAGQISLLHHLARSFVQVGLGHLSGERGMLSLSEGEARRVRLAAILEARGQDLGLLLDEPARGLHEEDIEQLVESLRRLKQRHTVILNDHRLSLARAVDWVVELGPGAGQRGGRIVQCGPPAKALTIRPDRLVRRAALPVPSVHPFVELRGGTLHTLKGIDARIPLGRLTAITGVSGSGKSNFVRGLLVPALAEELTGRVDLADFSLRPRGTWKSLRGAGLIEAVLALDQRRPETNRRSLVATLLGVADSLRKLFAAQPEARELRLEATDFGLNAGRGRCSVCLGLGAREEPGGWVQCPRCGGRRFGEQVLAVHLAGRNLAELLDTPVEDLAEARFPFGSDFSELLALLCDLDLGHINLGRRVDRLSGGEVQRLRIAHRLWKRTTRGLFLVLDEPSAGLHPQDVAQLSRVLDRIVSEGENTIVLVEHNLDLIRSCDWILDFGPGGGPAGGKLLGQGSPQEIEALDTPTGRALRRRPSLRGEGSQTRTRTLATSQDERPAADRAGAALRWLRVLLGHEVEPPSFPLDSEGDLESLAALVDERQLTERRPHEIGGLDLELARLFLEATPSVEEKNRLLHTWINATGAYLVIQPLLPELQVWGPRIPKSALKEAHDRLESLGLDVQGRWSKPADLRAAGPRFEPAAKTPEAHSRALAEALTLGGGYVELLDRKGRIAAKLAMRFLDLEEPAIAPLVLTSTGLSRLHGAGACPACEGRGSLTRLNDSLLLLDQKVSPESDRFFVPGALEILKGVRRATMLPFFRRLSAEGLWEPRRGFHRLSVGEREIFFDGYWHRPGPGSFLKDRKAEPEQVSSWLRWDGLYRAVLGELDRSRNTAWAEEVRRSRVEGECSNCRGTGLNRYSRAVYRDGRSLDDWIRTGCVGELHQALRRSPCHTERELRTRNRLIHCLEPLARRQPKLPLRHPVGEPALARTVFERVVHSFTTLRLVG